MSYIFNIAVLFIICPFTGSATVVKAITANIKKNFFILIKFYNNTQIINWSVNSNILNCTSYEN